MRQKGFFSEGVDVERGCTQGDTDSPIIFNLIIDAVLRTWKQNIDRDKTQSCFYADDGLLENTEDEVLQEDLDEIIKLFGRVGLKANEQKTKYMIVRGAVAPMAVDPDQYEKQLLRSKRKKRTIIGVTKQEKMKRKRTE